MLYLIVMSSKVKIACKRKKVLFEIELTTCSLNIYKYLFADCEHEKESFLMET